MNTIATIEAILKEINFPLRYAQFREDLKKFDVKKPCFGFSLQNGLLVIAIIDVIGGVLGILPLVIMLTYVTIFKDLMRSIKDDLTLGPMESAKTVEKSFTMFLAILTIVICVCLLEFYLTMVLLNGAKKKVTKCYLWWKLTVVFLIAVLFIIAAVVIRHRIIVGFIGILVCSYKAYCYWIVKLFIAEIGTLNPDLPDIPDTVATISDMEEMQMHKI